MCFVFKKGHHPPGDRHGGARVLCFIDDPDFFTGSVDAAGAGAKAKAVATSPAGTLCLPSYMPRPTQ